MKKTLLRILFATLSIALPISIASCDGNNSSTNTSENADNMDDDSTDQTDEPPASNADCFEGKTYRFIGTQSSTIESTSPIVSSSDTDANYDLTIEFFSGGTSLITGTVDVTSITTTVAGNTFSVTEGLGPINVDQTGVFNCVEDATGNTEREVTVVEGGITTVYTLTFTSATSGTFETTITGIQNGAVINATSSGTFMEL